MPLLRKVNKDFFKEWSSEMSYVLGFFAADGNMTKTKRHTHFISFHSSDLEIISSIKKSMSSEHRISERVSETGILYRLQIGSIEMFKDINLLGFSPGKTNNMSIPKIPEEFVGDFVRGYFDGDGNVWVGYVNKHRKNPTSVIQVAFTSGNKNFLQELKSLLNSLGVQGGSIFTSKKKNFSRLQFSTTAALKLAEIMYNTDPKLCLQRKRLRFKQVHK